MNNISMNQALDIWGQLWQAYYGNHPYGSDTAEIYAYLVTPCEPTLSTKEGTFEERKREIYHRAALSLSAIVCKFAEDNDVLCQIDGESPDLFPFNFPIFDHRCYVKVIHLKGR